MKEIDEVKVIIKRINELNTELVDLYNTYHILLVKLNKKVLNKKYNE